MAPGLPQSSVRIAERAGRLMNSGEGLYGGFFISCMYSAAFLERGTAAVVEQGLACLPPQSRYAKVITDVLAWAKEEPANWEAVWKRIEEKWNRNEACPEGALQPFNIDAALNGAYVALGLLYGKGDFDKTIEISTRAGQDSDCNPSSAAGILGVMLGWKGIPDTWKRGIAAISNEKFRYTDYTFNTIVDSTLRRALALIRKTGGRYEPETAYIRREPAKAARFEAFNHGEPKERIAVSDPRWQFKGEWRIEEQNVRQSVRRTRISAEAGSEATVAFEGNGVILSGPFLPACGTADIYLDGKLRRTVDCYPDEEARKNGEALWHDFDLPSGKHELRVVVRGETIFESKGTEIALTDLVVFR
jgi:hypothetical protein